MTSNGAPAGSAEPAEIDTSVAHAARVYDYLLGGRANFKVDRDAAARAYAAFPGGLDGVRADVRQHRAVLGRMVRYFVEDAGIVQFLDIGTGIPRKTAAKTLDFSRPTAVMLFGILHFFSDADDPHGLIGQLMAPLAAGSGQAMSHPQTPAVPSQTWVGAARKSG